MPETRDDVDHGQSLVSVQAVGLGRPVRPLGLDGGRGLALLGRRQPQGALFYFDITEINYPYRFFFAEELRAGRFSRWCPWLYCGMPLYSESQAGYLHPFKYLFYPWMETWKAFNLDTVLSIWLTGPGTYGWLRRHVRPAARTDRRRHLRAGRLHLGASGPHQHDQRPGQRSVRDLGAGVVVGNRAGGGAWSSEPLPWPARCSRATCRTFC